MLYVTGADWFCMCDRAGPEAPAMGYSTGTQMSKWARRLSHTWLCSQTSPGFPGFGFCSTFFRSAPTLPLLLSINVLLPYNMEWLWFSHGGGVGVPFTPCVNHLPTPPVGHSEALHLFCFQFPHKWLWGHLDPMYYEGDYSTSLPGPWGQSKQLSVWLWPLPSHVWNRRDIYFYLDLDCLSPFLEY